MKDVREQDEIEHALFWAIEREFGWIGDGCIGQIAAHIAERFDVTPKPVVTAAELGGMARKAVLKAAPNEELDERAGGRMLDQLDAAGLRLVRVEEGEE